MTDCDSVNLFTRQTTSIPMLIAIAMQLYSIFFKQIFRSEFLVVQKARVSSTARDVRNLTFVQFSCLSWRIYRSERSTFIYNSFLPDAKGVRERTVIQGNSATSRP